MVQAIARVIGADKRERIPREQIGDIAENWNSRQIKIDTETLIDLVICLSPNKDSCCEGILLDS